MKEKQKHHKILQRQIRKILGRDAEISPDMKDLLETVSETYQHYDDDRYMLERSIELSSKELLENNKNLKLQKQELENTLEELISTQQQLAESEKLAKMSKMLAESNEQILQQQEETKAAYEELQAVHEDLQSTQTQLIQSEKMSSLGQLTAGVAHEINNPVNFVYGGVQALDYTIKDLVTVLNGYQTVMNDISENYTEDEYLKNKIKVLSELQDLDELKEEALQMIEDIKVGAERTADIVRGLRNFSRSDGTTWQQADLHEGLDSTLVILNSQIKGNIEVVKNYSNYVETIQCYAGQLNQVFMNILSNSIQAIEGKGTIWITTEDTGNAVKITLKDSGKGMPNSLLDKIFDPFFTTKEIGSGTGLGLSISYGIVEKHQGSIEVKSTEGEGTQFTITIPKLADEPKPK